MTQQTGKLIILTTKSLTLLLFHLKNLQKEILNF